jgi:hypothetical protein
MNKVTTQFDIPEVHSVFETNNNYKILNLGGESKTCLILFSSNDLYFPNTTEEFVKKIIKKNRYEWEPSISDPDNKVSSYASKVIFVRDVKKQWYIEGINGTINTIDKVYSFLQQECQDCEQIICAGVSAGGFAATLFGCLLKASRVYNFSGQFTLMHHFETEKGRNNNPTVIKYLDVEEKGKYYNLDKYIESSNVPIFYFYPVKCPLDIRQFQCVKGLNNIYEFAFNSANHGDTCFHINFLSLFGMETQSLINLHQFYQNKIIDTLDFSMRVSGLFTTVTSKYFLRYYKKKFFGSK